MKVRHKLGTQPHAIAVSGSAISAMRCCCGEDGGEENVKETQGHRMGTSNQALDRLIAASCISAHIAGLSLM